MSDFYVTFGQWDRQNRDGWVRLANCTDREQAHDFAMKKFFQNFSMLYDFDSFKPEYFPAGEIEVIDLSEDAFRRAA